MNAVGDAAADPRIERVRRYFESLARDDLARIGTIYTDDASFKDPFNEVQGVAAVRRIYEHMFDTLDSPRFVIRETVVERDQALLIWDFHFSRRGKPGGPFTIRGATHLRLASDGRIAMHRDYWDAAEELYEKLPLIGAVMRWLRRRIAA